MSLVQRKGNKTNTESRSECCRVSQGRANWSAPKTQKRGLIGRPRSIATDSLASFTNAPMGQSRSKELDTASQNPSPRRQPSLFHVVGEEAPTNEVDKSRYVRVSVKEACHFNEHQDEDIDGFATEAKNEDNFERSQANDIRAHLQRELELMDKQMQIQLPLRIKTHDLYLDSSVSQSRSSVSKDNNKPLNQRTNNIFLTINENKSPEEEIMSADQSSFMETSSTHESSSTPLTGTGSGALKSSTTERRTTTTTTTKRTIKSSDDFMPASTDIQQVRSESRTSSISSSSPLFSAAQQQAHSAKQQQTNQQAQTTSSPMNSSSSQQQTTTTRTSTGANTTNSSSPTGWSSGAAPDPAGLQSPIIQDTEEGRVLKLRFDVTQYDADEIVVKTLDNRLTVQAKHEEKSENRSVYREYNREFHLPDGTDVEAIRSSLSRDGVLTVECPLPTPQARGSSRQIPIERSQ